MDISVYEAKTHLSRLIADVEAGEEVTITRHGKPVARLVPATDTTDTRAAAVDRLRALKRELGVQATPEEIRSWIDDGKKL
ncbi:MAG: type II toxin-antitoxin system prevent-host-death family antitoxin [Actinobacteria bacterium]|nr:type II toxin-antitoxin system prevent-host-death family antitoxin [Actinomycetota bacterium]